MKRLAPLGVLALALAVPTVLPSIATAAAPETAPRAPVGLGITASAIDVAMTGDGAAHIAWLSRTAPGQPFVVNVCRLPQASTTCTTTATLAMPDDNDVTGPFIVTDGTKVVVAAGNRDGASESTYAALSADGASAYTGLSKVGPITASDVEMAPGGGRLWMTSTTGPTAGAFDYLAFSSTPLPGAGTALDAATFTSTPGGMNDVGQLVGVSPEGRPVAFVSGSTPAFASGSYFRAYPGAPDAGVNTAANWGALTKYDLPAPHQRNGDLDVFSGNGRMWVGYEGLQRDTVLRPFAGNAFGAPVSPDCVDSRWAAGTQDSPDVAVSRTGDLLVTETGSDGSVMHLGYFHGTADGSQFSPYTELATAPGIRDVETAADPTSDAGGVVVWTADDIYGGAVSFARMPSVAPAPCAAPGGVKKVAAKVGGTKVQLSLPAGCVPAATKYKLSVAPAGKKAKAKVSQVVFSATGAKKKTDKSAPFKTKLKVKASASSGKKIKVKAKVTVRPPKGKPVSKTLKSTFTVC